MCVNELVAKGCKDVSSSDVYNSLHHYHVIVVSFRFEPLLSYLISRIDASGSDSKCWSLTSNGMPLVKSFYDLLIDGRKCCSMTPIIWRDMCPLKVKKSLIGWLRKPNSHSPKYDTSIYKKLAVVPCVLCYADTEIVDHLILLYPFSTLSLRKYGIALCIPFDLLVAQILWVIYWILGELTSNPSSEKLRICWLWPCLKYLL